MRVKAEDAANLSDLKLAQFPKGRFMKQALLAMNVGEAEQDRAHTTKCGNCRLQAHLPR